MSLAIPTSRQPVSLTLNNTGNVDVESGTLVISGAVTGTGSITIETEAEMSNSAVRWRPAK